MRHNSLACLITVLAMGFAVPSAVAAPLGSGAADLKTMPSETTGVEQVRHRRCYRHRGHWHCPRHRRHYYNYGPGFHMHLAGLTGTLGTIGTIDVTRH